MWRAILLALVLATAARAADGASDRIDIVTTGPTFALGAALAHGFAQAKPFAEPVAEASEDALKRFCAGVGTAYPDLALSERSLSPDERKACRAAGVTPIEVTLGYFGLAILRKPGAAALPLTSRTVFLAIAKDIPSGPDQQLVANASSAWNEVDPKLPKLPISIFGPPAGSEGAQSVGPLLVAQGARTFPALKALEMRAPDEFKNFAEGVRSDSVYKPRRHGDDLRALLQTNPDALVIADLSSTNDGTAGLSVAAVNGVTPQGASLANGSYPYAQQIRLFVKREHLGITPGLRQFLDEALGGEAIGEHGYLRPLGLVPRPPGGPNADSILSRAR
ncbi:MAG: substrate-binding domain-containing protein [Alphaproteobacteria bacterium]